MGIISKISVAIFFLLYAIFAVVTPDGSDIILAVVAFVAGVALISNS